MEKIIYMKKLPDTAAKSFPNLVDLTTTLGLTRKNVRMFYPVNIQELKDNFLMLRKEFEHISTVSTGNNWGYGCGAPSVDNSLVINLSKCNQILDFDSYHGIVTIGPGVTYGQLAAFLKHKGGNWIAPVHGGGPDCSVLGNALERGYGITPHSDHFGAIQSLSAILNNGEMYEGALKNLGQERLDKLFRYGIGPYTDGLFSQSGIGIVTEMTIRLSAKPAYVEMFYINLMDEKSLIAAVEAIKNCKKQLGSCVGGINLINKERFLSMLMDYPLEKVHSGEPLSRSEIEAAAKKYMVTPWFVVGMMYGEKGIVKEAKKIVQKNFKHIRKRTFFFNTSNKIFFGLIGKILAKLGMHEKSLMIGKLFEAYDVLLGNPNNVALRLSYWKNPNKELVKQENLNPNRDNCGLIWYAPLVEMQGEKVQEYTQFIRESAEKFRLNALITLTTVDDLCFDSTIPILFNKDNEQDSDRAYRFYRYLLAEGAKRGFFPYRLNIETQKEFDIQNPFFKIEAINPDRYK